MTSLGSTLGLIWEPQIPLFSPGRPPLAVLSTLGQTLSLFGSKTTGPSNPIHEFTPGLPHPTSGVRAAPPRLSPGLPPRLAATCNSFSLPRDAPPLHSLHHAASPSKRRRPSVSTFTHPLLCRPRPRPQPSAAAVVLIQAPPPTSAYLSLSRSATTVLIYTATIYDLWSL
jgi:hypothetical protein